MRELSAGFRADVVNEAGIVGLQKRARRNIHDGVPILINGQVFLLELNGLHPQFFGNPRSVGLVHDRRDAGAAVCTFEAINIFENFLMNFVSYLVEPLSLFPLQFFDKFLVLWPGLVFFSFPDFNEGHFERIESP